MENRLRFGISRRGRNLELYEVSDRHFYFENGKLIKSGNFWAKIESLNEKMRPAVTDQSFKDFLSALPDDEETRRAKAIAVRYIEASMRPGSTASGFTAWSKLMKQPIRSKAINRFAFSMDMIRSCRLCSPKQKVTVQPFV